MTPDQAAQRQAAAANDHDKLLRELQIAHMIIGNAQQLMTVSQRLVWSARNSACASRVHAAPATVGADVIAQAVGSAA
jgi:hypothetical protein